MLMVLIYNLADTLFIGMTNDDLQVAAVSLATPVFLLFMAVGTVLALEEPLRFLVLWARAKWSTPKRYALFACGAVLG